MIRTIKFSGIAFLTIMLLVVACDQEIPEPVITEISETQNIGPNGGTITLDDVASAEFDQGSLSENVDVQLIKVTDEDLLNIFDISAPLYGVDKTLRCLIKINTSSVKPNGSVQVTIQLPTDFLNSVAESHGVEAFVQAYNSNTEKLDLFEILPSTFNTTDLVVDLPDYYFVNVRTPNKSFEAVLTVASVPGYNLSAQTTNDCGGQFIGCPVADCSTPLKTFSPTEPHFGTDFTGTNVIAAHDGTVIRAGNDDRIWGWGQYVIIENVNGQGQRFATAYTHLKQFTFGNYNLTSGELLDLNEPIQQGDDLGVVGATGGANSPQLHFEYFANANLAARSAKQNPIDWITAVSVPKLLSAAVSFMTVNTCERPTGVPNSGSPWKVTFQYEDPSNTINANAKLTFTDVVPSVSNPYTLFVDSLDNPSGTLSSPVFCGRFDSQDYLKIQVFLTLENGMESNCIYFELERPDGANKVQ